jgi:hypothetical protein
MSIKKKKQKKSVERVKPPKAEIIQVKENSLGSSQNANSQIVQVIFPTDMELRKVKKRKRGKSEATKKKEKEREELLETLKSELQQYDAIQAELQQQNIKIPSELGLTIINKSDLKTNDDIRNYINDITRKKQALIQLKTPPPQMGLPMRLGSGVSALPQLPPLMPTQIQMPQVQPQPPQPPQPPPRLPRAMTPPAGRRPSMPPTPPATNRTEEELRAIAKDLEDRAKAQGKTPATAPPASLTPVAPLDPFAVSPPTPQTPAPTSQAPVAGLEPVNIDLGLGSPTRVFVPAGFTPIYKDYQQYLMGIDNVVQNNQVLKGVYHIPIDSLNNLIESRDKFNTAYNNWIRTVPKEQSDYINNPSNVNINRLINDMTYAGIEEPRDMVERQLQNAGIDTSKMDITEGTQSPALVQRIQREGKSAFKTEADGNEYDKVSAIFADLETKMLELNKKISELPALSSPDNTDVRAYGLSINRLEERLTTDYNKIKSPAVQLAFIVEKDKYFQRFNEMRQALNDKQMVVNPLDDDDATLYGEPIQLINPKSAGLNMPPSPPSGSLNPKGGLSPPPSRAGSTGSTGSTEDPAGAFPTPPPSPKKPAEPAPAQPAPAQPAPAQPAPAQPAPAPQQPPTRIGKNKAISLIRNYVNTAKKGGQVGYSVMMRNAILTIYGEDEYDKLATVFNTSGKTNRARNIQRAVIELVNQKGLEDAKPPPRKPPAPPAQNLDPALDLLAPGSGMSIVP